MNAKTNTPRLFSRLIAGIILSCALVGCGFFGSAPQPAAPPPHPVPPKPVVTPAAPPPPKPADNSIALLLPLGGPFREFGGRVQRGAMAAKAALAASGKTVDVVVIDVTQPGWLDAVRALPPNVTLVGGPVHPLSLKELQSAGLLSTRVFVSFMSTLGDSVREGVDAWRFFPSHEDEVDALLRLSLTNYGINQYAILRPGERYAQTMADTFAQDVSRLGGQVTATGVYAPQDPATWEATVQEMIKTGTGRPGFGAVFIPDSWDRVDKVLPYFFRNKVEDLLILGPQLWTESLFQAAAAKAQINIQNYRLAVCPGAWWPENQGRATQDLLAAMRSQGDTHVELWEAIGYDFVRLADRLGPLPPGDAPQDVSARLAQAASGMDYSMAPLSYSPDGIAHVAMYLFRPSVAGPVLLDPEGFRQRLNAIRQKALENPAPESEQSYAPAGQQPGVPPTQQPGTMPPAQPIPGQQPGVQQPTTATQPAPVQQPAAQQPAVTQPTQQAPAQTSPVPSQTVPAHKQSIPTS